MFSPSHEFIKAVLFEMSHGNFNQWAALPVGKNISTAISNVGNNYPESDCIVKNTFRNQFKFQGESCRGCQMFKKMQIIKFSRVQVCNGCVCFYQKQQQNKNYHNKMQLRGIYARVSIVLPISASIFLNFIAFLPISAPPLRPSP